VKIWLKIALNTVRLPKFEPVNGISWSPRKIMVKDLRQRSGLAWFCACAENCVVFIIGPYTVLPDNCILITANMQSETGFPSSHQLQSYVAYNSRLKLPARTVLSADAGLLVNKVVIMEKEVHSVIRNYWFHYFTDSTGQNDWSIIRWVTFITFLNKKASIRWQDSEPPISGYWPTSEPNAG